MAKRKVQPLSDWLREVAGAATRLAEDIDRDVYSEEPPSQTYDIECGCSELIDYIGYYRVECEEREASQHDGGDDYAELRHLQHERL